MHARALRPKPKAPSLNLAKNPTYIAAQIALLNALSLFLRCPPTILLRSTTSWRVPIQRRLMTFSGQRNLMWADFSIDQYHKLVAYSLRTTGNPLHTLTLRFANDGLRNVTPEFSKTLSYSIYYSPPSVRLANNPVPNPDSNHTYMSIPLIERDYPDRPTTHVLTPLDYNISSCRRNLANANSMWLTNPSAFITSYKIITLASSKRNMLLVPYPVSEISEK